VRSVADFEGKRIRAFGIALPAAIQAIGGVPVSMSTVETYEALERGEKHVGLHRIVFKKLLQQRLVRTPSFGHLGQCSKEPGF
jgi:hypothetical protein